MSDHEVTPKIEPIELQRPENPEPPPFFTVDWSTANHDRWLAELGHLAGRPGVVMVEIGCFEGRSSRWFLDNILTGPGSLLICVDPWIVGPEYERRFDHNTAAAQHSGRLLKLRGTAQELVRLSAIGLEPLQLDAVYIDGDHQAESAFMDAGLTWGLVRRGGVVMFDDYDEKAFTVRAGVDAFARILGDDFEITHKGYQVIGRKSESAWRQVPFTVCPLHSTMHLSGKACGQD